MPHNFFKKPSNALFEHGVTLSLYQEKQITFNPKDTAHTKLIDDCTRLVKEKLTALQAMDIKITTSFSLGTIALGLSWFLPLSLLAGGCFAYGAYQMGQRKYAYAEYTEALENLARCCHWTLGEVRDESILNNPSIEEMRKVLAPLMNEQQLRDFIDDKVEDKIIEEAETTKQDTTFFEHRLNPEENQLYFKIYGYQQGTFLDILKGIGYAIRNSFMSLKAACMGQQNQEPTHESMQLTVN
ncbi:hypothetical protein [Legionella cardiaca]|uniref:Transmembrane protein n=1 Tax=Legionella cardiaca TaxID=1071983 RepID=A0ABY8AVM1_9GAMM|nr:hypothetical protein [Legionella cardiaca]WED43786.1 hypothetical protein PXX05_03125 [Legionella cardiaca]